MAPAVADNSRKRMKRSRRRLRRSRVLRRRVIQEVGKLRYLAPSSRPAAISFGRFFNSVYISTGHRLIYVKNDKAGSSFIIRSLIHSEKKAQGMRKRTSLLKRELNPLLTPAELTRQEWDAARAGYFVFTFCRNPYTRVLSAYLDRIVGRDESYYVLQRKVGFPDAAEVTFPKFLEMLEDEAILDLDTHWKPQHRNIGHGYYDFSFIGRFESFSTEFPEVLRRIYGRKAVLGDVRAGTEAGTQVAKYCRADTAARVRRLYAKDFELFGYGEDLPLSG
jgi:hypothetical protein